MGSPTRSERNCSPLSRSDEPFRLLAPGAIFWSTTMRVAIHCNGEAARSREMKQRYGESCYKEVDPR